MPRKSVRMLRENRHVVVINGRGYTVQKITQDGESFTIDLGEGVVLHRTGNAKVEVR